MRRYGHPLAVAIGGAAGALARWSAVEAVGPERDTLVVFALNVLGSLVVGGLTARRELIDRRLELLIGTGFAGGLTTFSTFAVTVARQLDEGALLAALVHAVGTLAATLLAAGVAYRVARPRR